MKKISRFTSSTKNVPVTTDEIRSYCLGGNVKNPRKFNVPQPFIIESLREMKIEGSLVMGFSMFDRIHNREITNAIISPIAVEVVNVLVGTKLAPEVLFHDPSMLEQSSSVDGNSFVSTSAESVGCSTFPIALTAAERSTARENLAFLARDRAPAQRAIHGNHSFSEPYSSLIGNGGS